MSPAGLKPPGITTVPIIPHSQLETITDGSPTLNVQDDCDAHSFVVRDGGLSRDLSREETEQQASTETKHVGTWAASLPSTPSTLGDADLSLQEPIVYLDEQLRKAKKQPASFCGDSRNKRFVPRSDQKRIITPENIRSVLESQHLVPSRDLDSVTHMIHDVTHIDKKSTTMRIIFSILILLKKPNAILDFIGAKIYDKDLPLECIGEGGDDCDLASKGSDKSIPLFQGWKARDCDLFLKYQWEFLVPIFHLPDPKTGKSCYWKLDSEAILPIMKTGQEPSKANSKVCGGSADVLEAEIHWAHLCHGTKSDKMLRVAIKRLRKTEPEDFHMESDALNVVSAEKSPHLTSLLFTFQHQDCYHLVFQWAENGNLRDVWRKYKSPCHPPRNHEFVTGFAKRLLGLAQGLQAIHKCHTEGKPYGIHGDIKPANILSFKGAEGVSDTNMGVLKITDFGYTTFHGTVSVKKVTPKGFSLTYSAPEYQLLEHVSQSYDVWSLGCVFLEYATWHLRGGDGVKEFANKRVEETHPNIKGDYFFTLDCSGIRPVAKDKKSVKQHFHDLRSEAKCSDFILDILDYTEKNLLRIDPENRAPIQDIVEFLLAKLEKCEKDEGYAMRSSEFSKPSRSFTVASAITTNIAQLQRVGAGKGPSPLPQRGCPSMRPYTARNPTKDQPGKGNSTNTVHEQITGRILASRISETPNTESSDLQEWTLEDEDTTRKSCDVENPVAPPREGLQPRQPTHHGNLTVPIANTGSKEVDDYSSVDTVIDKSTPPSQFALFGCLGLGGRLLSKLRNAISNER